MHLEDHTQIPQLSSRQQHCWRCVDCQQGHYQACIGPVLVSDAINQHRPYMNTCKFATSHSSRIAPSFIDTPQSNATCHRYSSAFSFTYRLIRNLRTQKKLHMRARECITNAYPQVSILPIYHSWYMWHSI